MDTTKQFSFTIKQLTPMLMHSDRLCNPLDPLKKQMSEISSVRKKQDEHFQKMAEIEFLASIYWDKDLGIYVPSSNVIASVYCALKKNKLGKSVKAVSLSDAIGFSIIEMKGKTPQDLLSVKSGDQLKHVHTKSVVIQRSRIMRTRALFPQWSCNVSGTLDVELLSVDQFKSALSTAGYEMGIGDWRPELGKGSFGKFSINNFEVK
jgi:hypothetical protein